MSNIQVTPADQVWFEEFQKASKKFSNFALSTSGSEARNVVNVVNYEPSSMKSSTGYATLRKGEKQAKGVLSQKMQNTSTLKNLYVFKKKQGEEFSLSRSPPKKVTGKWKQTRSSKSQRRLEPKRDRVNSHAEVKTQQNFEPKTVTSKRFKNKSKRLQLKLEKQKILDRKLTSTRCINKPKLPLTFRTMGSQSLTESVTLGSQFCMTANDSATDRKVGSMMRSKSNHFNQYKSIISSIFSKKNILRKNELGRHLKRPNKLSKFNEKKINKCLLERKKNGNSDVQISIKKVEIPKHQKLFKIKFSCGNSRKCIKVIKYQAENFSTRTLSTEFAIKNKRGRRKLMTARTVKGKEFLYPAIKKQKSFKRSNCFGDKDLAN